LTILHLYKDYYPVLGGIENHVRMLARLQARRGHQVGVLACSQDGRTTVEHREGVRIVKAGRLLTLASMPISLRQPLLLRREIPDVVHVHAPYPLGAVANWLIGPTAAATVITHHCDIVRQRRLLKGYAPLLRRVLRSADGIIATNPQYLRTSLWLRPVRERCTIVPLGIDVPPRPPRRSDGETLLFVGRLRYYKGVDVLLRALPLFPRGRLVIVGDGPMRLKWQRLALELGVGARVLFTGEVTDTALAGHYAAADVFVLPSVNRAEAFGMVLLEAMAAGLPLISTELGTGTSWVNLDGRTGRVVPSGDPGALAAAITELLADRSLREEMGRAARARLESEFDADTMVRRIDEVYENALRGRAS